MNMSVENNMLRLLCQTISMRPISWLIDFPTPVDKSNLPVPEQQWRSKEGASGGTRPGAQALGAH